MQAPAGNTTPWSNSLAITFDSIAPATPVLDLPAGEDSGYSHTDNITNVGVWHCCADYLDLRSFPPRRSSDLDGVRDVTSAIPTVAAGTPCCGYYYYPDTGG